MLRQNKLDDATRYVDELLKSDEGKTVGKYWRGRLALAKGQSAEAIAILQEAVREQPTFAPAHYYLGFALQAHNNLPSAKMSFSEAIKLAPHFVEAHLALIRLHILRFVPRGHRTPCSRCVRPEHSPANGFPAGSVSGRVVPHADPRRSLPP